MSFVVKNTTKWGLLDLLCPHSCRGCGVLGSVLCERCKNYIIQDHQVICPHCRRSFSNSTTVPCQDCESIFQEFWIVGWREGALSKLVSDLKYKSVRACSAPLSELLDHAIPSSTDLGQSLIIVPLPTIGKHIRERGFDHTLLLAKKLAKHRGWKVSQLLQRATDTTQVGTSAAKRKTQAENTYGLNGRLDPDANYLLLDDVWTTGASMLAAAKTLQQAGAKHIYGAVIEIGRPNSADTDAQSKD